MPDSTRDRRPTIAFGNSPGQSLPVIPFRIVAMGDFAPEESSAPSQIGSPLRVDKDSFNQVLRQICPRLAFHLARPGSKPEFLRIDLQIDDLKSFHPAAILSQVEHLRRQLEGRNAIVALRDRKISREQFLSQMESTPLPIVSRETLTALASVPPPARPTPPGPAPRSAPRQEEGQKDALDSILDMVVAPSDSMPTAPVATEGAERVNQFISAMLGKGATERPVDRRAAEGVIAEVDRFLSAQLNEIVGHPEFQRLEGAWRGLKFLVDRTDFREQIQLELLPSTRANLARTLGSLVEQSESVEVPIAVVVTNFEFGSSTPDMELLRQAAESATELQAPLIVNAGPSFFGKETADAVARLSNPKTHLEAPEYVKWSGLAEAESSRWVGVAFNRFLLRGRYDEATMHDLPFTYQESGAGLWGNASWAIASLLVRSFAQSGWAGHITGLRGGGAVENLPLHDHLLPSGEAAQIPLETVFLKDRHYDFYEAGFLALQCGENQDFAALLQAPTAHRPERYSDARETEASRWRATLTYQMVATRFIHYLAPLLQNLITGSSSEIQQGVERGLRALLKTAGVSDTGSVVAQLRDSENRAGFFDLYLRIRPGPQIWSLPVDIELSIPIRKA